MTMVQNHQINPIPEIIKLSRTHMLFLSNMISSHSKITVVVNGTKRNPTFNQQCLCLSIFLRVFSRILSLRVKNFSEIANIFNKLSRRNYVVVNTLIYISLCFSLKSRFFAINRCLKNPFNQLIERNILLVCSHHQLKNL